MLKQNLGITLKATTRVDKYSKGVKKEDVISGKAKPMKTVLFDKGGINYGFNK